VDNFSILTEKPLPGGSKFWGQKFISAQRAYWCCFKKLSTSYPQVIHRLSTGFQKMDMLSRWANSAKIGQVIHKKALPLLLLYYIYIY